MCHTRKSAAFLPQVECVFVIGRRDCLVVLSRGEIGEAEICDLSMPGILQIETHRRFHGINGFLSPSRPEAGACECCDLVR